MSGTLEGGRKAAKTNRRYHGRDFYARIGSMGGRKLGVCKGFAANPELARTAGYKGGKKSSRKGVRKGEGKKKVYYGEDENSIAIRRAEERKRLIQEIKQLEAEEEWA